MATTRQAVSSLLHPVYGAAAADVRRVVGASPQDRLRKLGRQVDEVRRAMVLRDREFRGMVITQDSAAAGTRITPDHRKFIAIDCPDGSIAWDQGNDGHELVGCVDVSVIITEIKALLLADPGFTGTFCAICGATPA